MNAILLSASSDDMSGFFILVSLISIGIAVLNLLLIIKFFELAKDVREIRKIHPILEFLCSYLQTQFSYIESQSSYIPTEEDFKAVVIGSWESDNENYVFFPEGTYEKNVHFSSWDREDNSTTKGTWKIEGYNITLSPTESTNKEIIKDENYMAICLTMSKIVLKNNENNSKITLNRT